MTGSSRTDAGVHALQNFFHFDTEDALPDGALYHINAILAQDIVVKQLYLVRDGDHSRFDAVSREYHYFIYQKKDPFLKDRAFYYPFPLDFTKLVSAASVLIQHTDYQAFSKRNTQAKTTTCSIIHSQWIRDKDCLVFQVIANRFLRGMVRGLVGTMLQTGRGKLSVPDFEAVIEGRDASKADFSVPAHGLFLVRVSYPAGLLGD